MPAATGSDGESMTAPTLSNYLADLAERAGEAYRLGRRRSVEAAAAYLDCGHLLAKAKAECGHGQWLPFLERADIPKRTAQRMIRLASADLSADDLASRGVRAALADLTAPKSVTVTHLQDAEPAPSTSPPLPPAQPAPRGPTRYQRRREAGLCVDCGAPAEDGKARCGAHREAVAEADRRRRERARVGEALAPRLAEAAKTGAGLELSADEVAELAGAGTPAGEGSTE